MAEEKKRRPNWSKDDCLLLTELVKLKKTTLEGKFAPGLTSAKRQEAWQKITEELNASSATNRCKDEVEKKWKNMKAASKKCFSSFHSATTATGGGPPPTPLSPLTDAVVDVVGRENVTLTGIQGGCDTTLLQLQFTSDMNDNSTPVLIEAVAPPASSASQGASPATTPNVSAMTPLQSEMDTLLKEKLLLEIECLKLKRTYYERKLAKIEE